MCDRFYAYRSGLSVYINNAATTVEVFYLAFPRFNGRFCDYTTLVDSCRARIDSALKTATVPTNHFEDVQ